MFLSHVKFPVSSQSLPLKLQKPLLASLPGALARQCLSTLDNPDSSSVSYANSRKVEVLFSLQRRSLSES